MEDTNWIRQLSIYNFNKLLINLDLTVKQTSTNNRPIHPPHSLLGIEWSLFTKSEQMYWEKQQSYGKGVLFALSSNTSSIVNVCLFLIEGCLPVCGVNYLFSPYRFFSQKTVITKSTIHKSILLTHNKKPNDQFVQNIGRPIYGIHQSQLKDSFV